MDQHVYVYEERGKSIEATSAPANRNNKKSDMVATGRTWRQIWQTDINAPIEDIKFAPKSSGLVLSVACADGSVRFFQPQARTQLKDWAQPYQ